jgi:DAACS family dicarboxylate/amino acid:cation (Na+ or H+) symporter
MLLGVAAGLLLGTRAAPLGAVGKYFIQLIKVLAIPLVFFSVLDAVVSTSINRKKTLRWMAIVLVNSVCALSLGLLLSNLFSPGEGFQPTPSRVSPSENVSVATIDFSRVVAGLIPVSIIQPFAENNLLTVVLLALLLGAATRVYLSSSHAEISFQVAEKGLKASASIVTVLLLWLVKLAPIAVFCVTARTVGESGLVAFKGLALYVALGVFGMLVQIGLVYSAWIVVVAGIPIRAFIKAANTPVLHAFGTNSSLATLPLTLQALDGLQVHKSSSRLAACIGTNFNNDGILLYEAMAVLFVAQAVGLDLSLSEQLLAALISLVAAVGVAGVPEAGVVSLSLVLATVGLPVECVPLLLTVDWIVARVRSVTNVLSDMTVSIALDALTKEPLTSRAGQVG